MQAPTQLGVLATTDDWSKLKDLIDPTEDVAVLQSLLATFENIGAKGFLLEEAYIDRDFSAAYSAFYASVFYPYLKYCRRLHFFTSDMTALAELTSAEAVARDLEERNEQYLGFIVLRPVKHAPVGIAVASTRAMSFEPSWQIELRASYVVHVLGAELKVEGFPLTQQDTRVGACAQAVIWMAGRHFHKRHGGPWFSMPEINEAALKPTDGVISRSLPAGSEFLTPDNIVRALRAMDRHPVVYAASQDEARNLVWVRPVHQILSRYLDSGIPVIVGLRPRAAAAVGHAVVATGRVVQATPPEDLPQDPTSAEMTTHVLVHDDQRGVHQRLPVRAADRTGDYPWTLEEDAAYLIVPLPPKVFMTAEVAETLARDYVDAIVGRADEYRQRAQKPDEPPLGPAAEVDSEFTQTQQARLIARTYLTYGWKYKRRALRNRLPAAFKSELMHKQFPRYVWVTEFALPGDVKGFNVCDHKVRAHVVVDATGSRFWDSVLVVQVPGLSMFWAFNPASPPTSQRLIWRATDEAQPFLPKVRGWADYEVCDLPIKPA
ncbi:hypothetical protein [Caulobacter sp. SSI4214]|uniref:hypothetical protein n=1 Tax=Caulobacter sp. SSI4214 TaxID=2575739 RepID=UPI00143AD125|nr:hypothetical protein [Caulobacter sp. SSI4214]